MPENWADDNSGRKATPCCNSPYWHGCMTGRKATRCDSTADGRRCIKQADHLGIHWNDDKGDLRWSDRTADVAERHQHQQEAT